MQPNQGQPQGFAPYTPEQLAQWQQQGYTPEQIAQWQQQQAYTPDQAAQWQQQGYTPEQVAQWQQQQGYTPEQVAQWQQWQGYTPDQFAQMQQQQGYTTEQLAQMQMQYEAYLLQAQQMQQMQAAPPAAAGKRPRRQKQPRAPRPPLSRGAKLLYGILILALVAVGAWLALRALLPAQATTATVERSEIGNVYSGDALIVRNETAYDEEGVQNIEYVAQEGAVIYRGDVVCYVYSTGYSSKETTTLQDYRDQIKDYQRTLLRSETAYDQKMTRLDGETVQRGLEVRSLVQGARGNLTNQETILENAIEQRQAYFRSKYSSDMRLNRLYDDEKAQITRIEGWIKQKVATEESIVSFYTDGFEYALSPSKYEVYSPSEVRSMIGGEVPQTSSAARGRTDLYRLVKKNNYAVLMLIRDSVWNPVDGETYKLVLEQFSNTDVDARVLSHTRSGGELLVRLAVIGDVTDVLYMRTCQARLGEYVDCMSVPEKALYQQMDAIGVVLVTPEKDWFVPVKVLRQENGTAYISAVQTGILTEGQTVRLFH